MPEVTQQFHCKVGTGLCVLILFFDEIEEKVFLNFHVTGYPIYRLLLGLLVIKQIPEQSERKNMQYEKKYA